MKSLGLRIVLVICIAIIPTTTFAGADHLRAALFSPTEIRIGGFWHNAEDNDDSEDGADINLELLFGKPSWSHPNRWIKHFITPRPHIGGHINTSDSTSQFYFGLTWDHQLTERLYFETSFGGALHDGPRDNVGELSFGCSLNFRESASLGVKLSKHWRFLLTIDHMSNANLCDRNGGLTNVGGRFGYTFE